MRKIPLRNGGNLLVDDSSYSFMSQFKDWKRKEASSETEGKWHAVREVRIGNKRLTIRAHRLIMEAKPDQRVVAINGNLLDCRRRNLQIETLNPFVSRPKKSGFMGVHQIAPGKWRVEIEFGDRKVLIDDECLDPKQGALAYDKAARKLYGANATTNF